MNGVCAQWYNALMEDAVKAKKKSNLWSNILLAFSAVLFVTGVVLIVRQYVYIPQGYTPPPSYVEITPVPTVAPTGAPVATPSPTPYIKPVPVKIYFTERKISADIVTVAKDEDGRMDTVDSASLTAWYEPGPAPGEEGNALVNGHVRWSKVAGTFSILPSLKEGEEVVFEFADGSTKAFTVSYTVYFNFDDPAANQMMDMSGETRVTLISCYGEMNHEAHTSEQRVFVVLVPKVQPTPTPEVSFTPQPTATPVSSDAFTVLP